ncbi:MAG: hypothetical protein V2A73_01270 [Pseudomonadota bacterium]
MSNDAPRIGASYYALGLGNSMGIVTVRKVKHDSRDCWIRVQVEYCDGCMTVPPPDRPDAPLDEWELPVGRCWLSRREWERCQPELFPPEAEDQAAPESTPRHTEATRTCQPGPRAKGRR